MKYIKLFESYNKKYYDAREFRPSSQMKLVDISQDVIDALDNWKWSLQNRSSSGYLGAPVSYIYINDPRDIHKKNEHICIYQYEDEWFQVAVKNSFSYNLGDRYWCDQLDGLLQCLEDKYK